MKRYCLFAVLLTAATAQAELPEDPLASPLWEYNIERYLGTDVDVVVDERVGLSIPDFAEDSTQVPLAVDLSEFPHGVEKVVTWIDMNPVPLLFAADMTDTRLQLISLNFRVQQASSVRAAVLDEAGTWHIDSGFIEAAGGGCTAPRVVSSDSDWEREFGTLRTGLFSADGGSRIKVNLLHPMDSGMAGNVPAFFVRDVEVRREDSESLILSMNLAESAAQNPMFVFEFLGGSENLSIRMKDNNGYRFEGVVGSRVGQ